MYNLKKVFCSPLRIVRSKTALIFFSLAVLLLVAAPALATDFGLSYGTYLGFGTQDLRVTIMNIIRIFLGFLGIIAIILVIYAGWLWMSSAGNEEKITQAKNILRSTLIGLAIIISSFAIVSFIIAMLTGALGGPGTIPGVVPPPAGCDNCVYLGSGIIESVYPAPMSTNNDRDTAIIVTFKEEINPESIIANKTAADVEACGGPDNPCSGILKSLDGEPVVKIFKRAETETGDIVRAEEVNVVTTDKKTYTFIPPALGDSVSKHWYTVKLTNALTKESDDSSAFPGVASYFSWDFEVGTKFDTLPPKISSVFPYPDYLADDYTPVAGARASGSVAVAAQPKIDREPTATLSDVISDADIDLEGIYNGTFEGAVTFVVNDDRNAVDVSPPVTGWSTSFPIQNFRIILGVGTSIFFQDDTYAAGNSFTIAFVPKTDANTFTVSSKTYKFVAAAATPGDAEIRLGASLVGTAENIANKIQTDNQDPNVDASVSGANVALTAVDAGTNGNFINIAATGSWANISIPPMSGGINPSTSAVCAGACDQPRNAVIKLDFNEGIMPSVGSGKNTITIPTDATTGEPIPGVPTGVGKDPTFSFITVQADINTESGFQDDEYVSGTFIQSNQYKTIEFVSLQPCGTASGIVTNSCGDPIYCLPVRLNSANNGTLYRVTIKAAALRNCNNASECLGTKYETGEMTETCSPIPEKRLDLTGDPRVCGDGLGIFYPKANALSLDGIADLANNSFDGNADGFAKGSLAQSFVWAESLNNPNINNRCDIESAPISIPLANPGEVGDNCTNLPGRCKSKDDLTSRPDSCRVVGDDLIFDFWISNRVDISSPVVIEVDPGVNGSGSSLLAPVKSDFNKLLMSSTIKSGGGYNDGRCTCSADTDCNDPDQKCLPLNADTGYCVNTTQPQDYCSKNVECKQTGLTAGFTSVCETKKYISFINPTTIGVGWWLTNIGRDVSMCLNENSKYKECTQNSDCGSGGVCGQTDSYFDRNSVQINHTRLAESTRYGAEIASGVKDIYQNCFIPGKGPTVKSCVYPYNPSIQSNGCCDVDPTADPPRPYCCNGVGSEGPCE